MKKRRFCNFSLHSAIDSDVYTPLKYKFKQIQSDLGQDIRGWGQSEQTKCKNLNKNIIFDISIAPFSQEIN